MWLGVWHACGASLISSLIWRCAWYVAKPDQDHTVKLFPCIHWQLTCCASPGRTSEESSWFMALSFEVSRLHLPLKIVALATDSLTSTCSFSQVYYRKSIWPRKSSQTTLWVARVVKGHHMPHTYLFAIWVTVMHLSMSSPTYHTPGICGDWVGLNTFGSRLPRTSGRVTSQILVKYCVMQAIRLAH